MSWKTAYRSFYYANAEPPEDISLPPGKTALLVIDIQNTYLEARQDSDENARWQPFFTRMNDTVIPNTIRLLEDARRRGVEVIFARIACLKEDGRDRSLSQKKPGFNYLLLPKDRQDSQLIPALAPQRDEITVPEDHRQCIDRHQPTLDSAQYGNRACRCRRDFYRSVRVFNGA